MSMVKLEHLRLILILDLTEVHLIAGGCYSLDKNGLGIFSIYVHAVTKVILWLLKSGQLQHLHVHIFKITPEKIEEWTTFYREVFFTCNNLYY